MVILDLRNCGESPRMTFFFRGRDILLDEDGGLPSATAAPMLGYGTEKDSIYDSITGAAAVELSADFVPVNGYKFQPIRQFFVEYAPGAGPGGSDPLGSAVAPKGLTPLDQPAQLAARMKGYLNWKAAMHFCPGCGTALKSHEKENALVCPNCGKVHYPRIEPCVIAVICKDDKILLLRHVQRNQNIWCCLAGFVEAGESLEEALVRETREETGLEIENIRYFSSQSWPFPDQLMVGFFADWKSGEIRVQEDEIFEAKWFSPNDLPPHPAPGSISWELIHNAPVRNPEDSNN